MNRTTPLATPTLHGSGQPESEAGRDRRRDPDVGGSAPPGRQWLSLWRGPQPDPSWARPALLVLLAATAVLYLWDLGASGWANSYYAAAVQAGSTNRARSKELRAWSRELRAETTRPLTTGRRMAGHAK